MEIKCEVCEKYFATRSEKAKCCGRECYSIRRARLQKEILEVST